MALYFGCPTLERHADTAIDDSDHNAEAIDTRRRTDVTHAHD